MKPWDFFTIGLHVLYVCRGVKRGAIDRSPHRFGPMDGFLEPADALFFGLELITLLAPVRRCGVVRLIVSLGEGGGRRRAADRKNWHFASIHRLLRGACQEGHQELIR